MSSEVFCEKNHRSHHDKSRSSHACEILYACLNAVCPCCEGRKGHMLRKRRCREFANMSEGIGDSEIINDSRSCYEYLLREIVVRLIRINYWNGWPSLRYGLGYCLVEHK